MNLPRKKHICICVNKTDRDTADNKQEHFDEVSNEMKNVSYRMTSWTEHPQPAEMLEQTIRMTENGDDWELEHRFQSSRGVSILQLHMSHHQLLTHPSTHVEHERTGHTMSRLQPHKHKGWRFATESPWTLWHTGGWHGHPRYTVARTGKAVGGPTQLPRDDQRQHDRQGLETDVLSGNNCRLSLGN